LQFFESHGQLDVFGYPITEMTNEGSGLVQYFQRAKMEWHPENPIGSQVSLGNLGSEYLSRFGLPYGNPLPAASPTPPVYVPALVTPIPTLSYDLPGTIPLQPNYIPTPVTPSPVPVAPPAPVAPVSLRLSASTKYAITGQGGSQTVYVQVTDDRAGGLGGAEVQVVVHFYDGDQTFVAAPTDASGTTSVTFNIGYPPPGHRVLVEARATYRGQSETVWVEYIAWW
jgi:hypothetical protein